MKKVIAFLGLLLLASPAAAQRSPSGSTFYGPHQTITCLQGGQIIFQYYNRAAVLYVWNAASIHLEFNEPDGSRKVIDLNPQAITCLIEEAGKESVPLLHLQKPPPPSAR